MQTPRINKFVAHLLLCAMPLYLAASPCDDSLYVELRNKPVEEMIAGEAAYYAQMQTLCNESRARAREAQTSVVQIQKLQRQRETRVRVGWLVVSIVLTAVAASVVVGVIVRSRVGSARRY